MRFRSLWPYAALAILAVALDQWAKALVEAGIPLHGHVDLLPFLALYHTRNTGIAFSILAGAGDWGLVAVGLAVVAVVLFLASRTTPGQIFARVGFAIIIGGAAGNLIDRIRLGYVIDYILFHTPAWSFAVFNLADSFITVGAALVVLEELIDWLRGRRADQVPRTPRR